MRNYFYTILLFLCTCSIAFGQTKEWITVKDTIAAYIIDFPAQAKKSSQDVPTEKGNVVMNSYTVQTLNDKNLIYMTSYTKYPDSFFPNGLNTVEEIQAVLDGSVAGAVKNTNGTLLSDTSIVFNGYQGRNFQIGIVDPATKENYIIHMHAYMVDLSLYITQVIYSEKDEANDDAWRFFESFELINVKR